MNNNFLNLNISKVEIEAKGQAKSLYFDMPVGPQSNFSWKAGQHITLKFILDGEELRRSFTLSNAPSQKELRVTVKRVVDGLVSKHINDNLKTGDTVDVMRPYGSFFVEPGYDLHRTHYFYAGGSGITPVYSMIKSVLEGEPRSVCHLLYANKHHDSIIFRDKLDELLTQYEGRLTVSHVLSEASIWSLFQPWATGRIDKDLIAKHFDEFMPYAQNTHYYVCGPGKMNDSIRSALEDLDVPDSRIYSENFASSQELSDLSVEGISAEATVVINDIQQNITIEEDQTILDALLRNGYQPPYSCQSGFCGACRARVVSGDVHMRNSAALEDHEVSAGQILTCQSVATSSKLEISYS